MVGRVTGSESGMAYLTILFLMAIVTSLALAFLQKTSIGTSSTVTRGESMQAHYLAESAANHAMWRLLHESDFPAESDKYYMHSLAGGRYGYKVRRHTGTTFATVATVGAIGDHVVHQSYVLYVKSSAGLPGGIYWLQNSDSKVYTPSTGTWRDVDISGDADIPDGATGVVLEIVNEHPYTGYRGEVRANGGTDTLYGRSEIAASSQIMAFVKLDENKIFEAYRNSTDIKFYVRGYTGDKVTLFENWDAFYISTTGYPVTIDLSGSGVPGNSIAILELYDGGQNRLSIRRKGDSQYTYYTQEEGYSHQFIMVGVDANSMFEYYIHPSYPDVYDTIRVVGYMEDVGTWLATPSGDVSGYTTGSWVDRDITAETSASANVAFVNIINNDWSSYPKKADLRVNGSSDDQYNHACHLGSGESNIFYVIGLDESQVFETRLEDRDIDIHVLGYGE